MFETIAAAELWNCKVFNACQGLESLSGYTDDTFN